MFAAQAKRTRSRSRGVAQPMSDEVDTETRSLPAHIEGTVETIAKLHADHDRKAGTLQRMVERLTAWIGRPRFIAGMNVVVVVWIAVNLFAPFIGMKA